MQSCDRNTTGRLEINSVPQEQGFDVSLNTEQMEPPLEEQQSQQSLQINEGSHSPTKGECTLMHYSPC